MTFVAIGAFLGFNRKSRLQQVPNFATSCIILDKTSMIYHETRLPADNSHEISCLICNFCKKAVKFEIVIICKLLVYEYLSI